MVIGTAMTELNTAAKVKNAYTTKLQTISTALQTTVENGGTVARVAATAAQWALNIAMKANPIMLIITGLIALVAGIAVFISSSNRAEKAQKKLNDEMAASKKKIDDIKENADFDIALAKAAGASSEQLRKMNEQFAIAAFNEARINFNRVKNSKDSTLKMYNDAVELLNSTSKDLNDIRKANIIEETQERTDANNKKKEDEKKANEEAIKMLKETNERRKKEALDLIAFQEAEREKEKMLIDKAYKENLQAQRDFYKKSAQDRQEAEDKNRDDYLLSLVQQSIAITEEQEDENVNYLDGLKNRYQQGLLSYSDYSKKVKEYKKKERENNKEANDQYINDEKEKSEKIMFYAEKTAQAVSMIGNALFDSKKQQISDELDALQKNYTTDADEAKKNGKLKLISAEEMAKKQAELKMKQAKMDKEQALFNIALNTAMSITSALASFPSNVPLAIANGALGAIEFAIAASKPLPKYAKGKKSGGAGHFATIGEHGAETMWVPDNAAIIPHNKSLDFKTFAEFGIIPQVDSKLMRENFDYDKMGQAFAKHVKYPKSSAVTVNVDKNGIYTQNGHSVSHILNKKYTGTWN